MVCCCRYSRNLVIEKELLGLYCSHYCRNRISFVYNFDVLLLLLLNIVLIYCLEYVFFAEWIEYMYFSSEVINSKKEHFSCKTES